MRAISVKWLGPTNYRGDRVKAYDGDGNSITLPATYDGSASDNASRAARALANKMGWEGELVGGGTKDGWVFCFKNSWLRA